MQKSGQMLMTLTALTLLVLVVVVWRNVWLAHAAATDVWRDREAVRRVMDGESERALVALERAVALYAAPSNARSFFVVYERELFRAPGTREQRSALLRVKRELRGIGLDEHDPLMRAVSKRLKGLTEPTAGEAES